MIALYRKLYTKYCYFIPPYTLVGLLVALLALRPIYAARTWVGPAFCNPILWLTWQDDLMFVVPQFERGSDPEIGFFLLCILSGLLHLAVVGFGIFGIVRLFTWAIKKSKRAGI